MLFLRCNQVRSVRLRLVASCFALIKLLRLCHQRYDDDYQCSRILLCRRTMFTLLRRPLRFLSSMRILPQGERDIEEARVCLTRLQLCSASHTASPSPSYCSLLTFLQLTVACQACPDSCEQGLFSIYESFTTRQTNQQYSFKPFSAQQEPFAYISTDNHAVLQSFACRISGSARLSSTGRQHCRGLPNHSHSARHMRLSSSSNDDCNQTHQLSWL